MTLLHCEVCNPYSIFIVQQTSLVSGVDAVFMMSCVSSGAAADRIGLGGGSSTIFNQQAAAHSQLHTTGVVCCKRSYLQPS